VRHGWAFVYKQAGVALRLSQLEGAVQWPTSRWQIAVHLMGERLQYQDLENASCPLPFYRRQQEALQESQGHMNGVFCAVAPILGQKHPSQGDMLELTQVAEVVLSG
jgi:hypothetical protein